MERIPHWDYVWENKNGDKLMGMIIFPTGQGKLLATMKKVLKHAHRTKKMIPISILQGNKVIELHATVWDIDMMESTLTLKDPYGNVYDLHMEDVVHIGEKRGGRRR